MSKPTTTVGPGSPLRRSTRKKATKKSTKQAEENDEEMTCGEEHEPSFGVAADVPVVSTPKRVAKRKKGRTPAKQNKRNSNVVDSFVLEDHESCSSIEQLRGKKVVELREVLRKMGLKTAGRKEELVQRIIEHQSKNNGDGGIPSKSPRKAWPQENSIEELIPQSIEPTEEGAGVPSNSSSDANQDDEAILRSIEEELEREEAEAQRNASISDDKDKELAQEGIGSHLGVDLAPLPFPKVDNIGWPEGTISSVRKQPRANRRDSTRIDWGSWSMLVILLLALYVARYADNLLHTTAAVVVALVVLRLLYLFDGRRDNLNDRNNNNQPLVWNGDMAQRLNQAEEVLHKLKEYRARLALLVEKQRQELDNTQRQISNTASTLQYQQQQQQLHPSLYHHQQQQQHLLSQRARALRKVIRENAARLKDIDSQGAQLEHLVATKRVEEAFSILKHLHGLSSDMPQSL